MQALQEFVVLFIESILTQISHSKWSKHFVSTFLYMSYISPDSITGPATNLALVDLFKEELNEIYIYWHQLLGYVPNADTR